LNQAIRAHQQGDLDTAEALYRKVLARKLGQPDALHFLGVLSHQRGRSDEAVELIQAALKATPNFPDAHNNLGNIHNECGDLAEAEACYRRALACAHGNVDALGNLAVVLDAQSRLPEASAGYAAFLKAAPRNARAHYLMGLFLRDHAENMQHIEQAVDRFREAFALDGTRLCALHQQGVSLYLLGRREEARQVYRDWSTHDPDNPVPWHMLAACGGAAAPARARDAYVRAEFDSFANSFDEQLLKNLGYRAPQVLASALAEVLPPPGGVLDVLDAGCGTGLCAPLLRPFARHLAGVDLSGGMLAKARQRGGYDALIEAELTDYLQAHPAAYDVVVSADTLVYFGDLAPVLAAARAALHRDGWLGFSLEAMHGDGFELALSGRYRHGRAYVEGALRNAGFDDVRITADSLRKEMGEAVASWVVLARARRMPALSQAGPLQPDKGNLQA
jgi:predicted TPR repeat methyltransferase